MADDNGNKPGGLKTVMDALPFDRLKDELQDAAKALGEKAKDNLTERISGASDSLTNIADGGGVVGKATKEGGKAAAQGDNPVAGAVKGGLSGVKDKVKSALGGGGGGDKATSSTNIIESIDVGVPIDVAYNQWTQFEEFPSFMKKVENVEDEQDEAKLTFKAQVFWSHRTWEAKVIEQVPDERIVWKSKGEKGHVDGAVTFHELGPNLTRILLVLEYYPQGLFEKTGNIWRAQGRRAKAELKHFRRHVMTRTILHPDELEGWRGEVRDGEVVRSHDEAVEEEEREAEENEDQENEDQEPEDEYEDEAEEAEGEEEPEEDFEDEPEDEYEDEEPEGEEEPEEDFEEEPEDEYEEEAEPEDEPEEEGLDGDEAVEDYDEEPEEEGDESGEDELEDEELEEDDVAEEEEPEEKPRKRSSSKRSSSRKRR